MSVKDLKSKVDKLETLLNAKLDTPAQWAIDMASVDLCPVASYRRTRTEEEIFKEALELTEKYGTKENYDKAFLEGYEKNRLVFKLLFAGPGTFPRKKGFCDLCETALADQTAEFCKECHEKHSEKIKEIVEFRKQKNCGGPQKG